VLEHRTRPLAGIEAQEEAPGKEGRADGEATKLVEQDQGTLDRHHWAVGPLAAPWRVIRTLV
jgi:hypothetical protein